MGRGGLGSFLMISRVRMKRHRKLADSANATVEDAAWLLLEQLLLLEGGALKSRSDVGSGLPTSKVVNRRF